MKFDVDMTLLAILMEEGEVLQYNKGNEREYCGAVKGRPWLYPGDAVIRLGDSLYIVTLPNIDEVEASE